MTQQRTNKLVDKTKAFFPFFQWIKEYSKLSFNNDFFAGVITAILFVPQGMAYAMLAGLPVQVGLYASIVPPIIYAFLGSSRIMSVGPVSIAAIMIASTLASPEIAGLGSPMQNAFILAVEGGIILILMSVLGLSGLVNFLSHPVLTGFTSGAALVIIGSQLPILLGMQAADCGMNSNCLLSTLQTINLPTAAVGVGSLLILILMGGPLSSLLSRLNLGKQLVTAITKSAPLVCVLASTLLVIYFSLDKTAHISAVGAIPAELPRLNISVLFTSFEHWVTLLPSAFFISLIAYVESVAIAKIVASMRNEKICPNQELIALGVSNMASGMTGGMPVAGGLSRTMVVFTAGAQTQIAMLIAVVLLSVSLVSFADFLAHIPRATLAAIILIAVLPLVKLKSIITNWRYEKGDALSQVITLLGVVLINIETGLVLGVAMNIFCYLRRTSRPHIAVVGRIKDTDTYRNVKRHQVETWDKLLLIRIDENITFANINYIVNYIEGELKDKNVENIVLICSSVSHIDTTAVEALEQFIFTLREKLITLNLAEVKGPVLDKLNKIHFPETIQPGKVFFQTNNAVEALTANDRKEFTMAALNL